MHFSFGRRTFLALASSLMLAGCASMFGPSDTQLSGRFALSLSESDGGQSFSGHYRLNRTREATRLELLAPVYTTVARIEADGNGNNAVLWRGDKEAAKGADIESLIKESFNIALPYKALESWLEGAPAGRDARPKGPNAWSEQGWLVRVLRRNSAGKLTSLALSTDNDDAPVQVRLVLTLER